MQFSALLHYVWDHIRFERHSETTVTIIRSQWIVIFLEMIQSPQNHLLVLKIFKSSFYSQQRICWVSISGAGDWWHENDRTCTPRISGTVLEPCWNLSLLGCKAGQVILVPTRISLEHRVSPSSFPEIVAKPKSQKFIQPFPRKSSNSWRAPTTPIPAGPAQPARPARPARPAQPARPAAPRTRPRAAGRRRTRRRRRCEWRSQGSLRSPGASCSEGPGTPPTRPRGWWIGIIYTFKLRAWGSSYPPGSFRHPRDMAFFLLGSMPIIGRSCRFNIGIFPVIHVIDVATRLEPPSSRVSKEGGIPQSCGDGGLVSMARLMNRNMKHVLMGQYLRAVWKGEINIFNVWLGFDLYLLFHSGDGKPFGWFFFPRPSRILVKQFGDEKGFLIFGHTRLYFSISEVPGLLAIWSLRFVCSIGCMLPFWLALTFQDRGKLRRQGDILNSWPIYWRVSNIHICFGSLVILFVTKPRMAISHDLPFSTHSVHLCIVLIPNSWQAAAGYVPVLGQQKGCKSNYKVRQQVRDHTRSIARFHTCLKDPFHTSDPYVMIRIMNNK